MQKQALPRTRQSLPSQQQGVMLLEALIALCIFSVGILGLVALQARAISLEQDAQYRAQAAMLANQLLAEISSSNPTTACADYAPTAAKTTAWVTQVQATLPGVTSSNLPVVAVDCAPTSGAGVVLQGNPIQVQVTISWKLPSAKEGHSYTVTS